MNYIPLGMWREFIANKCAQLSLLKVANFNSTLAGATAAVSGTYQKYLSVQSLQFTLLSDSSRQKITNIKQKSLLKNYMSKINI